MSFDPDPELVADVLGGADLHGRQPLAVGVLVGGLLRWSPWGSLFNMARLPAISVPWAVPNHPPVGVHLGGITLSDAALLGLARILHP